MNKPNSENLAFSWLLRRLRTKKLIINRDDYQRNFVWSTDKQEHFITSVLEGYDLGQFLIWDKGNVLELFDGQQRLITVREATETDSFGLSPDEKDYIQEERTVTVKKFDSTWGQSEIQSQYCRSNFGMPHTPAERRHGMTGAIRDYISKIAEENDVCNLFSLESKRFQNEEFIAKLFSIEMGKKETSAKKLERMYEQYKNSLDESAAKRMQKTLSRILDIFSEKEPYLKSKTNAATIYTIVSEIVNGDKCNHGGYHVDNKNLKESFDEFFSNVSRCELALSQGRLDERDSLYVQYSRNKHGGQSEKSVNCRHQAMLQFLIDKGIFTPKDVKRNFSNVERMALLNASKKRDCITGEVLSLDEKVPTQAQIDHVVPWSKGGATHVNNAQVISAKTNQSKGNKLEEHA